jgi:pyruvate dehydrogenase E2 component (dihydrolipoamide acetyltransferase)
MLREFKFPDVGEGIAEAEIVRWLVKEGDSVKEDQDLLEVETDKAVLTLNSPYTGKIAKLHGREGEMIKVGDVLTTVDAGGEDTEADAYGVVEKIPLRGIRRTIAKRMAEASKRVAEVTIWEDADITELVQVRAKERKVAEEKGVRLTYLPFLIKAIIPALKAHPYFNASMDESAEAIILKKYLNIGIAVDTSDGLIVFVIKNADEKNILDMAQEIATLADKARLRKIDLHDLKGSTFTITNYGIVGASYGTPMINHPEVAILGLGKIEDRAVVRDGQIAIRKMMPLSLAFDHRVIDGVEAGRFLGVVIQHLEDPNLMLIEGK